MVGVAGVLLAAGAGRRFGGPKALAVLPDGTPFLTRAVDTLLGGGCDPVFVVLGAAVEPASGLLSAAQIVVNADWDTGLGSSLRAGLAALPTSTEAALVLLVDTPGIGPAAVARLLEYGGPDAVAVATYDGRRGHPVLLGRTHWAEASRLAVGDQGARPFLRAHGAAVCEVPCDDIAAPGDIDTPADLRRTPASPT